MLEDGALSERRRERRLLLHLRGLDLEPPEDERGVRRPLVVREIAADKKTNDVLGYHVRGRFLVRYDPYGLFRRDLAPRQSWPRAIR